MPSLEELIDEAAKYGKVHLYHSRDSRRFHFSIEFYTSEGIKLEAGSSYDHLKPITAVIEALQKAIQILESFKNNYDTAATARMINVPLPSNSESTEPGPAAVPSKKKWW